MPVGKYRFRLINIGADDVDMRVALLKAGVPVRWRIVAKDGADLPPAARAMRAAQMTLTVGETYDVEYIAQSPGMVQLEANGGTFTEFGQWVSQTLYFTAARPATVTAQTIRHPSLHK